MLARPRRGSRWAPSPKAFLAQVLDVEVLSHVVSIGTVEAPDGVVPARTTVRSIDADPVRCVDAAASAAMVAEIDAARRDGDTLGGVVEVVVTACRPGSAATSTGTASWTAGSPPRLMGIQAIKGVEIGDGFATARRRGSVAHDEIETTSDGVRPADRSCRRDRRRHEHRRRCCGYGPR